MVRTAAASAAGHEMSADDEERVMAKRTDGSGRVSSDGTAAKKREKRDVVRLVAAGVALVLLIAFVLDNSHTIKVGFVFFSTRISLIWALLIAAVLGALVDRLVILLMQRRKRAAARSEP